MLWMYLCTCNPCYVLGSVHPVIIVKWYQLYTRCFCHLLPTLQIYQVVWLRTLELQVQLLMRDVLGCSTVVNFQVVLCATVVSLLGPLLSICATLPIIWRDPGSENARAARVMETGVVLFQIVMQVSQIFLHGTCSFGQLSWLFFSYNEIVAWKKYSFMGLPFTMFLH